MPSKMAYPHTTGGIPAKTISSATFAADRRRSRLREILHEHDLAAWQANGGVDPGTGTYHGESFSPQRYEYWYNAGRGHAVPTIAGHEQVAGRTFAAAENALLYSQGPVAVMGNPPYRAGAVNLIQPGSQIESASFDLAGCYDAATQVEQALRQFIFHEHSLEIHDVIVAAGDSWCQCLSLPHESQDISGGSGTAWRLQSDVGTIDLHLERCQATKEVRDVSADSTLRDSWGDTLWQLIVTAPIHDGTSNTTLRFSTLAE